MSRFSLLAFLVMAGLAPTADAQFTPSVTTSFTNLNAGGTSGYTQDYLFLVGQEGPAAMTLSLDKGSFDFVGLSPGQVVANLTLEVVVDLPFPLPDIEGDIEGEVEVVSVGSDVMVGEAIVTFVDPLVLTFLVGLGFPDPSGQVIFTVDYTDLPGDTGVEMVAVDTGVLPTGGVSPFDVPLLWTTEPILIQSPDGGVLAATTTIDSSGGAQFVETENFVLVGGGGVIEFRRGDVNANGGVGLDDAVQLLNFQFAMGPEPPCVKAADVDDSGTLGLGDPISLLNFQFVMGSPPPPPPGPTDCGPDPTSDPLTCVSSPSC